MILVWISVLLVWMYPMTESAPVPMEMVDLTHVFDNDTLYWPQRQGFELKVLMNSTTDEGYWLQMEEFASGIHVGTHMDAPCHFARGRWTVDQIPLSRLVAPAAVVDITEQAEADRDYLVQISDFENWEKVSGSSLDGTIILLRSGWHRRWGDWEAFSGTADNDTSKFHFPGVSEEAAQWLVDFRNIYGLGTEALSIDHGPTQQFMTHRILLGANIFGLENMDSLEELPMVGATLHVMPMKIGGASGAPVRVIATFPKVMFNRKGSKSVTERSLREVIIFS